jgi:hypothetical protein
MQGLQGPSGLTSVCHHIIGSIPPINHFFCRKKKLQKEKLGRSSQGCVPDSCGSCKPYDATKIVHARYYPRLETWNVDPLISIPTTTNQMSECRLVVVSGRVVRTECSVKPQLKAGVVFQASGIGTLSWDRARKGEGTKDFDRTIVLVK